jgi:hypothetical protein
MNGMGVGIVLMDNRGSEGEVSPSVVVVYVSSNLGVIMMYSIPVCITSRYGADLCSSVILILYKDRSITSRYLTVV